MCDIIIIKADYSISRKFHAYRPIRRARHVARNESFSYSLEKSISVEISASSYTKSENPVVLGFGDCVDAVGFDWLFSDR